LEKNKEFAETTQKFFKEEVKCYGVRSEIVRGIGRKYYKNVKLENKNNLFLLCEELFSSGYLEEFSIGATYLPKFISQFQLEDIKIFKKWIEKYVDNWAKCDTFCNHTVGSFIEKYPVKIKDLLNWAKSDNRWLKRASAVSLVIPAKKGLFQEEIFKISDILLVDKDDMVQKGYGWLLKELSRECQEKVLSYVIKNKDKMPRTSLRYAIELMPNELRHQAMKK
jgi:3-methyladenine DNA glycosylase AlkD